MININNKYRVICESPEINKKFQLLIKELYGYTWGYGINIPWNHTKKYLILSPNHKNEPMISWINDNCFDDYGYEIINAKDFLEKVNYEG